MVLKGFQTKLTAYVKRNHPVFFTCLITSDIFFIAMFGLLGIGVITDMRFSLIHDQTHSELFQYMKFFWLAICFLVLLIRSRELMFGFLSILCTYLLLDDYFEIHENAGKSLAETLGFSGTSLLGATEFGELIVFAIYGLVFVSCFIYFYLKSQSTTKQISRTILFILFAYAFFAAVVDVLHSLQLPFVIRHSIGAVEDGGELLAISVLLWYVYTEVDKRSSEQSDQTPIVV